MNTIGITHNLDRARIRKLLLIGLSGAILTGAGDFLLGFAKETDSANMAASIMASAPNLADWQLIAGGLLGFFGIFLEGLGYFAIYRLMADAAPRYAHIFRGGIFGYIWLAPVGCHLNMGILNMAYKYLLLADADTAAYAAQPLIYGFSLPVYILLVIAWLPMIIIQFKAFAKGYTPYHPRAKWFNLLTGAIPALLIAWIVGPKTAPGAGIGTMFLSTGNAVIFGGLLITMPGQDRFSQFEESLQDGKKDK